MDSSLKRSLSWILVIFLSCFVLPSQVFAEEECAEQAQYIQKQYEVSADSGEWISTGGSDSASRKLACDMAYAAVRKQGKQACTDMNLPWLGDSASPKSCNVKERETAHCIEEDRKLAACTKKTTTKHPDWSKDKIYKHCTIGSFTLATPCQSDHRREYFASYSQVQGHCKTKEVVPRCRGKSSVSTPTPLVPAPRVQVQSTQQAQAEATRRQLELQRQQRDRAQRASERQRESNRARAQSAAEEQSRRLNDKMKADARRRREREARQQEAYNRAKQEQAAAVTQGIVATGQALSKIKMSEKTGKTVAITLGITLGSIATVALVGLLAAEGEGTRNVGHGLTITGLLVAVPLVGVDFLRTGSGKSNVVPKGYQWDSLRFFASAGLGATRFSNAGIGAGTMSHVGLDLGIQLSWIRLGISNRFAWGGDSIDVEQGNQYSSFGVEAMLQPPVYGLVAPFLGARIESWSAGPILDAADNRLGQSAIVVGTTISLAGLLGKSQYKPTGRVGVRADTKQYSLYVEPRLEFGQATSFHISVGGQTRKIVHGASLKETRKSTKVLLGLGFVIDNGEVGVGVNLGRCWRDNLRPGQTYFCLPVSAGYFAPGGQSNRFAEAHLIGLGFGKLWTNGYDASVNIRGGLRVGTYGSLPDGEGSDGVDRSMIFGASVSRGSFGAKLQTWIYPESSTFVGGAFAF